MTGTITKRARKGGKASWGYVFDDGRDSTGKRLQITKSGFSTKRDAEAALREAIATANTGAKPESPTLRAFFDRWMRECAARNCSPKTVERYSELGPYAIRQMVDVEGSKQLLGDLRISELRPLQLQSAVNSLLDRGGAKTEEFPLGRPLSPKTVRHIATLIHGCLEKAVVWELIARNPMDGIDLPKLQRRDPKIVEKDSVTKLLERGRSTRLYPFILLGLACGLRRGELLALYWSDIDFETGMITVSKSLEQTRQGLRVKSTKSGKTRRFSVPKMALEALNEHRLQQDGDRQLFGADYKNNSLLFCQPNGDYYSPDRVGARVSELMRKAGLEGVSLHSLRHTHASELLSKGVPIAAVSRRLGHASPNITLSIYAHALEADEIAAAKVWNDAMVDVISDNNQPDRSLANVSRRKLKKVEVIEKTG